MKKKSGTQKCLLKYKHFRIKILLLSGIFTTIHVPCLFSMTSHPEIRKASLPLLACFDFDLRRYSLLKNRRLVSGRETSASWKTKREWKNKYIKKWEENFFIRFAFDLQLHFIKLLSAVHWSCNNTSQLGGFLLVLKARAVSELPIQRWFVGSFTSIVFAHGFRGAAIVKTTLVIASCNSEMRCETH